MNKVKVLLVDDEKDFLDVMGQRIEAWGYSVVAIVDPRDAIEAIKNNKAEIAILDYMMPEMDGLSVAQKIREISPNMPLIMFTAHPDYRALEGSEQLQVTAFIPKFSSYSDAQAALKSALAIAEKKIKGGQ